MFLSSFSLSQLSHGTRLEGTMISPEAARSVFEVPTIVITNVLLG